MRCAQAGDARAYTALLRFITPHLHAIARRYLWRREDREDVVQDVLLAVHGLRHTYDPLRPLKPWLNTIAARRCIDHLRRNALRLRYETGESDAVEQAHGASPDEELTRHHRASAVRCAVSRLPARQREAMQLLRLGEYSLDEASALSRQSVGSLKVASHRAIKSLRGMLCA